MVQVIQIPGPGVGLTNPLVCITLCFVVAFQPVFCCIIPHVHGIMRTETKQISIKGVRDGILIALAEMAVLSEALQSLESELISQQGFLGGSRVILSVGRRAMSAADIAAFQELLAEHDMTLWTVLSDREESRDAARDLALATRLPGSNADLNGNQRPPAGARNELELVTPSTDGANSLLLRETIRSGRSIYHERHVVIIGDVNPGAEVIAGGDVVVWGRLRGLVHAGAHGDDSAVICALNLSPTQLRIADQIAIAPGEERRQASPEKVRLIEGQIVAEAWNTKN